MPQTPQRMAPAEADLEPAEGVSAMITKLGMIGAGAKGEMA